MSHQQGPPTLPACTVPQGGCLASFPVGVRVTELLMVMEEVDPRPTSSAIRAQKEHSRGKTCRFKPALGRKVAFGLMISQRSFPHSGVSVEFWGTPRGAEFGFHLVTQGMAGNAGFLKPGDHFAG